jgi:REP element-mobilizing transposase RayT
MVHMDGFYQDKYRIAPARLANWDYGSPGLYFITICTQNRQPYFGHIESRTPEASCSATLLATEVGRAAIDYWQEIPAHFPFIELDAFVLMPDHLHGVLLINKPLYTVWKPNTFGPQSQNLASVIRGYKAAVKKYANLNNQDFGWQPRYYDRVVRSENELNQIRLYIAENPDRWLSKSSPT